MKNIKNIVLITAATLVPLAANADTADILSVNNQAGVQITSENVSISGVQYNGITVNDTGNVPGFALSASMMKNLWLGNDYIEASYGYNSGHTGWSGPGAFSDTTKLKDANIRYGKGFSLNNQVMLTPYGELGYHAWYDGSSAPTISADFTNEYYGAGVLGEYSPAKQWVLSANALLGRTFGGNAASGGQSSSINDTTLYQVGIAADYAFTSAVHANIGLNYTTFTYPSSSQNVQLDNKLTTFKIGLGYAF